MSTDSDHVEVGEENWRGVATALQREIADLKRKLSDSIAREQEIGRKLKECRAHADALAGALEDIQWKSADKDNMEFTARITCYQQDRIRNALTAYRKYKEPGE